MDKQLIAETIADVVKEHKVRLKENFDENK